MELLGLMADILTIHLTNLYTSILIYNNALSITIKAFSSNENAHGILQQNFITPLFSIGLDHIQ